MTTVFMSYSREDWTFVERLCAALGEAGQEVWLDAEKIPRQTDWRAWIERGIEGADIVAFVISPDSLASEVCRDELDYALRHGKRIVPVLRREPETRDIPDALAHRRWIFLRDGEDFDVGFATFVRALESDLDWVRTHTRLLVRAVEWEAKGKDGSLLLRGTDLREAESQLAAGVGKEPAPTPLQNAHVLASRRAAARRQRIVLGGVGAALVVVLVLALECRRSPGHRRRGGCRVKLDGRAC